MNPEADRPIWQYRAGARRRRGGAAWLRGRREAAAGGWTTGEATAYPGPDGGRRLRRAGGWRRAKAPERRATGQQRHARVGAPVFFYRILINLTKFYLILTEFLQSFD
jgi:hypothetical protein